MNLDHDFFQVSKLSEEQKQTVFTKNGTLFSPNSGEDQKNDLYRKWNQARSQKFAMGRLTFGYGGGASSRRRPMGAGGRDPSFRRLRVRGRSSQRSKILHFFAKIA